MTVLAQVVQQRMLVEMISIRYYLYFFTYLAILLSNSIAQDILGCGGFLKSHADIDFTKVHVRL
jgi:hypothetical protein